MSERISVSVGDTVIICVGRQPASEAVVTKVGRVWITVGARLRLRLDDQTDGSGYAYGAHFYTRAQWAEEQEKKEAVKFLRDQGIELRYDSVLRGREVALANIIRAATQEDLC